MHKESVSHKGAGSLLRSQKGVVASHISWFYEIKQAGKERERKMGGRAEGENIVLQV